jgi:hypothetical protein
MRLNIVTLKVLVAKDAVMNLQQMESLSNNVEVIDLPFEP